MHRATKLLELGHRVMFMCNGRKYSIDKIPLRGVAVCRDVPCTGKSAEHTLVAVDRRFEWGEWVLINTKKTDHVIKLKELSCAKSACAEN